MITEIKRIVIIGTDSPIEVVYDPDGAIITSQGRVDEVIYSIAEAIQLRDFLNQLDLNKTEEI